MTRDKVEKKLILAQVKLLKAQAKRERAGVKIAKAEAKRIKRS